MFDYIPFSSALEIFAGSYLVSVILLLAVSYIGWVVVEIMEDSGKV